MTSEREPGVAVTADGPYLVSGPVRITRKAVVRSAAGEALVWASPRELPPAPERADGAVRLCRCGRSASKPYCDDSHRRTGFDGTEAAEPAGPYDEHAVSLGGTGIEVRDYPRLCVGAGFCENHAANVWDMTARTADSVVREVAMGMVERCPSGRLTYRLAADAPDNEPDLPVEVAAVADGPLWLTGRVPVRLTDGRELEVRNRVALCRCGASRNKPLCDGSHARVGFRDGDPEE
ncbi:CDGSH iron-sulfur domain-containing protein [Kitasatospora sp. NPDC058965]|uniref:CDGSH iron-sulfur domain-containing protein n=1 Tax=Kitasatospora sp. NPDC058965 TaxID=3346682 RepID=UPI00367F58CC